jgi:DUF438 domain-containing protein
MSELTNNSLKRKELLKHMILQLHEGEAPNLARKLYSMKNENGVVNYFEK